MTCSRQRNASKTGSVGRHCPRIYIVGNLKVKMGVSKKKNKKKKKKKIRGSSGVTRVGVTRGGN